jgi:hypothetical protein
VLGLLLSPGWSLAANDGYEPNNSSSEAKKAEFAQTYQISLSPKKDYDYFKLSVTEPGYLQVNTENLPKPIDFGFTVSFFDSQGKKIPIATGDNALRVQPGEYSFALSNQYERSSPDLFNLKVNFLKEMDDFEPNNSLETARKISFDSPYTITLFPKKDYDYFKFNVPEPGYLELSSENLPKPIDFGFTVCFYDAQGKKLTAPANSNIPRVTAGEYSLAIFNQYERSSPEPFNIKLSFLKEMDDFEPNNSIEQVKDIPPLGQKFSLALYPQEDVDIFRLKAESSGVFSLDLAEPGEGARIAIDFYDTEKKPLATNAKDILVKAGNTYYALIRRGYEYTWGAKGFFLIADIAKLQDDFEPNNSFETAKELSLPARIKLAVYPQADLDYFNLTLKEDGYLTELISGDNPPASSGDVLADIYGADKKKLHSFDNRVSKVKKLRRCAELKAGTYYLEVGSRFPSKHPFYIDLDFLSKRALAQPLPAEKRRRDFSFSMLGLGMKKDPEVWVNLKLLAEYLGGDFILADDRAGIEKAMVRSIKKAKGQFRTGNYWYLILLTLLLAAGTGLLFAYLIHKDRKK